jgi:hypothetical protein
MSNRPQRNEGTGPRRNGAPILSGPAKARITKARNKHTAALGSLRQNPGSAQHRRAVANARTAHNALAGAVHIPGEDDAIMEHEYDDDGNNRGGADDENANPIPPAPPEPAPQLSAAERRAEELHQMHMRIAEAQLAQLNEAPRQPAADMGAGQPYIDAGERNLTPEHISILAKFSKYPEPPPISPAERLRRFVSTHTCFPAPARDNTDIKFKIVDTTKEFMADSTSPYYIPAWETLLRSYPGDLGITLASILRFGALTGYNGEGTLILSKNLPSAEAFPDEMLEKITSDLAKGRIEITSPTRPLIGSPLGFAMKGDGTHRRIHHLSYPYDGSAVNDKIDEEAASTSPFFEFSTWR